MPSAEKEAEFFFTFSRTKEGALCLSAGKEHSFVPDGPRPRRDKRRAASPDLPGCSPGSDKKEEGVKPSHARPRLRE